MRHFAVPLIALFITVVLVAPVSSLDTDALDRADALYDSDRIDDASSTLTALLGTARTGSERAEVLWRLSRVTLAIGERLQDRDAPSQEILAAFEQGERYGVMAVEADAANHLGYYWQSANIGKWGQTRGILSSLFKAAPMRDLLKSAITAEPTHAGSFNVLGRLYAEVPGGISFGNVDYAVGLGRRAVALHEAALATGADEEFVYDYSIRLAGHLIKRDWNSARRAREQARKLSRYNAARDELERGWFFEGTVQVTAQDDKQEAQTLLRRMISLLEAKPDRSVGENRQLATARELLAEL